MVTTAIPRLQHPSDVRFHGIIGNIAGVEDPGTDGVVPVENCRVEWTESTCVVHEKHRTIPKHPVAVEEIRRVLQDHLRL